MIALKDICREKSLSGFSIKERINRMDVTKAHSDRITDIHIIKYSFSYYYNMKQRLALIVF